jgi:hypothetical protein
VHGWAPFELLALVKCQDVEPFMTACGIKAKVSIWNRERQYLIFFDCRIQIKINGNLLPFRTSKLRKPVGQGIEVSWSRCAISKIHSPTLQPPDFWIILPTKLATNSPDSLTLHVSSPLSFPCRKTVTVRVSIETYASGYETGSYQWVCEVLQQHWRHLTDLSAKVY